MASRMHNCPLYGWLWLVMVVIGKVELIVWVLYKEVGVSLSLSLFLHFSLYSSHLYFSSFFIPLFLPCSFYCLFFPRLFSFLSCFASSLYHLSPYRFPLSPFLSLPLPSSLTLSLIYSIPFSLLPLYRFLLSYLFLLSRLSLPPSLLSAPILPPHPSSLQQRLTPSTLLRYSCKVPEDRNFGIVKSDGKWSGLVGELVEGRADVVVTALDHNDKRAKAVSFLSGLREIG